MAKKTKKLKYLCIGDMAGKSVSTRSAMVQLIIRAIQKAKSSNLTVLKVWNLGSSEDDG